MKFRASAEDLAKGQLVRPGWHPVEIVDVEEGQDKDGAGLLTVRARVLGEGEDKGAILRANFSEKAQGMVKNFVNASGNGPFKADTDYDLSNKTCKGKKMEWFVERDKYRGRDVNSVVDYKELGA